MNIEHFVNYGTINEFSGNAVQNINNYGCDSNTTVTQDTKKETTHPCNDILHSEAAQILWNKAQEMQWIDENLQPLVSMPKAAILASVMADMLKMSPRWDAFEQLWGMQNLPNSLCKAQSCSYYVPFLRSVEEKLT